MGLKELLAGEANFKYYNGGLGNFVQKEIPYPNDSKQPYIRNDINNPKIIVLSPDGGLIRGGARGVFESGKNDLKRIGRFLTDSPQGPLFIAKQVGLQLSNPRLETRKIGLLNRGIFGNSFVGRLLNFGINLVASVVGPQPTRTYNLGINTLAQIPVNALGVHYNRHGFTPFQNENTKYFNVVKSNDRIGQNRLENLRLNLLGNPQALIIDQYMGGPDSIYGIGITTINRTLEDTGRLIIPYSSNYYSIQFNHKSTSISPFLKTTSKNSRNSMFSSRQSIIAPVSTLNLAGLPTNRINNIPSEEIVLDNEYSGSSVANINEVISISGPSNQYLSGSGERGFDSTGQINAPDFTIQNGIEANAVSPAMRKYINIRNAVEKQEKDKSLLYKSTGNVPSNSSEHFNGHLLPTSKTPLIYTNSLGESVKLMRGLNEYNIEKRIGSGRIDNINLTPLLSMDDKPGNKVSVSIPGGKNETHNTRDLIKFRIGAVDGDNPNKTVWMVFRAYLKGFTDAYTSEFNDVKYVGRGDKFHIFSGFDRKVSFSFRVAALSAQEMQPMYQKLNYLASNMTPDYMNGIMRGPMSKLTVGNWLNAQPGIMTSLTYTVADETPWEIALDSPEGGIIHYVLPHIVDVSMTFIPIGAGQKAELVQKGASVPLILDADSKNPWLRNPDGTTLIPYEAKQL